MVEILISLFYIIRLSKLSSSPQANSLSNIHSGDLSSEIWANFLPKFRSSYLLCELFVCCFCFSLSHAKKHKASLLGWIIKLGRHTNKNQAPLTQQELQLLSQSSFPEPSSNVSWLCFSFSEYSTKKGRSTTFWQHTTFTHYTTFHKTPHSLILLSVEDR